MTDLLDWIAHPRLRLYHKMIVDANLPPSQQITEWLTSWREGDRNAQDNVFAAVYPELRFIAGRFLHNERDGHTLEPAALVNEVCIRLLGSQPIEYHDRAHFFAIAAQAMRRILIDHARARTADKRGGERERVTLSGVEGWNAGGRNDDIIALDQALTKLEKADSRAARVVELRFFGGLGEEEIAEVLNVSIITVKRDWKVARAWLMTRLQKSS